MGNGGLVVSGCVFFLDEISGVCVGCVCTVRTDECDEAVKGPDGDVE